MGFLGYGDERLIIESRFAEGNDYFFQYLLSEVMEVPNLLLETDADPENSLFDYLLFLFPYYLQAAMRKGPYKQYVRFSYNDANVKGTIDVVRHIRQNTPFIGKIAYAQREFSFDNSLMELVRHTVEFIRGKKFGEQILTKAKDEVKLVIRATPGYQPFDRQKIVEANLKNPVRHAYYREYLALQRLCLAILRNRKHQIGTGAKQIHGVLFDGSWLWEEYVNTLLIDPQTKERMFYHPRNKGANGRFGAQRLVEETEGLIYPDFISKNPENRIIADAKYKPIDNIKNRDYLQVLAYMFRFDAKIGYCLYPERDDSKESKKLHLKRGTTFDEKSVEKRDDICVIKQGFKIPANTNSYDAFAEGMEKSADRFIEALGIREKEEESES